MIPENFSEILSCATINDLPHGDARTIAEFFDLETAAHFVYRIGGCTIYIPYKADTDLSILKNSDLRIVAEIFDLKTAQELAKGLCGCTMAVNKNAFDGIINKYILLNQNKLSTKELAVKTGKSERYIYTILKSSRK